MYTDNQSVDHSTLAIDIVAYNDSRDGQTYTENNVEVDENHIDINFSNSLVADVDDSFQPDIFDLRYWNSLDAKHIDILAQKGSKKETYQLRKILKTDIRKGFLHYSI